MNREVHVRFCEGLGVKLPGPTRQSRRIEQVADTSAVPPIVSVPPAGQDREEGHFRTFESGFHTLGTATANCSGTSSDISGVQPERYQARMRFDHRLHNIC